MAALRSLWAQQWPHWENDVGPTPSTSYVVKCQHTSECMPHPFLAWSKGWAEMSKIGKGYSLYLLTPSERGWEDSSLRPLQSRYTVSICPLLQLQRLTIADDSTQGTD